MRIGIDLRSLEGGAQHRGIGRYATQLIEQLSHIDHNNEYVFIISHPKALPPEFNLHENFRHSKAAGKQEGLRQIKYIRILYINARPLPVDNLKLDVFFHLDIFKPIKVKKTPIVSVLYDLIPFLFKDLYQQAVFNGYLPKALVGYSRVKISWKIAENNLSAYEKSAKVISISEHSKRDLLAYNSNINTKNVITIPLASGNPPSSNPTTTPQTKKLGLQKFLFYIGGADPRKGLVNLVTSMEEVWSKHPTAQLVLAGKEVTHPDVPEAVKLAKTVRKLSRPNQVTLLGFISDDELAWMYHHAAAFVFPSRYEGFGLPVLEAMEAGCPVIAYNNSSIPEVAGDAAVLVEDGESMAPAINKVLSDSSYRKQLIAKGKLQAKKFTWEETARRTLEVLEEVGRKDG